MFVGTHFSAPVILAGSVNLFRLFRGRQRIFSNCALFAIGVCGVLPDLLSPHLRLNARLTSWTHTVWFATACFSVIAWHVSRNPGGLSPSFGGMCGLAVVLHLFGDAISGGIAPLYPLSPMRVGNHLVFYREWFQLDLFMGSLLFALLIAQWFAKKTAGFRTAPIEPVDAKIRSDAGSAGMRRVLTVDSERRIS